MASLPVATQPVTREELNKTAHALAARAQQVAVSRGRLESSRDVETVAELQRDCHALRTEIEQLKRQCAQFSPPPVLAPEDTVMNLLLKERRLKAELAVLGREKISVISTREAVIQSEACHQLSESREQLDQLLTVLKSQRKNVKEDLEREQKLLKETRELEAGLERELAAVQDRRAQSGTHNVEADLRGRIDQADETIKSLRKHLVDFTNDEISQPSDEVQDNGKRKRGRGQGTLDAMLQRGWSGQKEDGTPFLSLAHVIQDLISLSLTYPHAPYHPLPSIWPPHANLLLRSGVIQRHPDNPGLVRVTPFHL